MADEQLSKVIVKLKDNTSIFHDASQDNATITGSAVLEVQLTPKISSAIRNGVLDKATESEKTEYENFLKAQQEAAAANKPAPTDPKASEQVENTLTVQDKANMGNTGGTAAVDYTVLSIDELKKIAEDRDVPFAPNIGQATLAAKLKEADAQGK
jgi:hypothetical protein